MESECVFVCKVLFNGGTLQLNELCMRGQLKLGWDWAASCLNAWDYSPFYSLCHDCVTVLAGGKTRDNWRQTVSL